MIDIRSEPSFLSFLPFFLACFLPILAFFLSFFLSFLGFLSFLPFFLPFPCFLPCFSFSLTYFSSSLFIIFTIYTLLKIPSKFSKKKKKNFFLPSLLRLFLHLLPSFLELLLTYLLTFGVACFTFRRIFRSSLHPLHLLDKERRGRKFISSGRKEGR